MGLVWYPGCGQDFNPVLTLLRSNPRREHVPPGAPGEETPTLWMTDYCPDVARYYDGLGPGSPLPTSPYQTDPSPVPGLRVQVDDRGGIPLTGNALRVRDVRRFNLGTEGSERARRESKRRWAENWGEDPNEPSGWDVTEIVLGSEEAPLDLGATDSIRVWFSPYESEAALRHVFGLLKARLHCVVLVRLGGFSCQRHRPEMDHHKRRFFSLLSRHASDTGTGLPEYVLTDRETSDWGDPDPYLPTGVVYQGWVAPLNDERDPGVRLLRKRDGELAGTPSRPGP